MSSPVAADYGICLKEKGSSNTTRTTAERGECTQVSEKGHETSVIENIGFDTETASSNLIPDHIPGCKVHSPKYGPDPLQSS